MRTDEQHTAPLVTQPGVGVDQVGGAVQGDDGLSGTRATVDDKCAGRSGADDRILLGLDGAQDIAHPGGPVAAQAGDEGGLVVERRVAGKPVNPVGDEHFVPVVADPAKRPAVSASAGQPHRVRVGGSEERLGSGGAPVDQQLPAAAVRKTQPSDVHGLSTVRPDDAPQAQIQTESTQCT